MHVLRVIKEPQVVDIIGLTLVTEVGNRILNMLNKLLEEFFQNMMLH